MRLTMVVLPSLATNRGNRAARAPGLCPIPLSDPGRPALLRARRELDRGAVDQELGRAGRDLAAREVQADHRVRAARARFGLEPVESLLARLGQQLGVLLDLAADEVLEPGLHVGARVRRAHGAAAHETERPAE